MECRRIIRDGHTYWNIKGCGDAARVFTGKFFFFRRKGCGDFCPKRGTNVPPHLLPRFSTLRQSKWEEIYGKTPNRTEFFRAPGLTINLKEVVKKSSPGKC